jgi:hypothetical protein
MIQNAMQARPQVNPQQFQQAGAGTGVAAAAAAALLGQGRGEVPISARWLAHQPPRRSMRGSSSAPWRNPPAGNFWKQEKSGMS